MVQRILFGFLATVLAIGLLDSVARAETVAAPAPGEFSLAAGETARLTNTIFLGCNSLTYGYQLSDGSFTVLGSNSEDCPDPQEDAIIGPFSTPVTFRLVLVDNNCDSAFDSTGDHARVTGTDPAVVDIFDGGDGCQYTTSPRTPEDRGVGEGDLSTTVSIAVPSEASQTICVRTGADWRAPYRDGSCPVNDYYRAVQVATASSGVAACLRVTLDVRATYADGSCPATYTKVFFVQGTDIYACIRPGFDYRAPYRDGTCPSPSFVKVGLKLVSPPA